MTEKIIISVQNTAGAANLGRITLNKSKALNALDLDMVQAMQAQLDAWRHDPSVGAIFIDSAGDKAFCAGGDIVSMYEAMVQQHIQSPGKLPEFMAQFFAEEYRLDYTLHAFEKPIICWGNGIIMGGGLGVFAGASHKVVTQTARVAMPEITIGLFPDVGASYFLNKMPLGVGKFLGLSAASINAVDCVEIGLATAFLPHDHKAILIDALVRSTSLEHNSIDKVIADLHCQASVQNQWQVMQGNLQPIFDDLGPLADVIRIDDIVEFFDELQTKFANEKIVSKAVQSFQHGSPITINLVLEQLRRAKSLTLAQCLQMELSMAYQCSVGGEFQEGVRALLIDKDNKPAWRYKQARDVPQALINAHFEYFLVACGKVSTLEHPLQSLVNDYGEPRA